MKASERALTDVQKRAELRDQLIAVLGHDLRNPLAAIQTGAKVLGAMSLGEKPARVASVIQSSATRMGGLVNNLLDFARARSGASPSAFRRAFPQECHQKTPRRRLRRQQIARENGRGRRSYEVNLASRAIKAITPEGFTGSFVSSDGQWMTVAGPDGVLQVQSLKDGSRRGVAGWLPGDAVARWTGDGRGLFLASTEGTAGQVFRVDLASGRRISLLSLAPGDPAGITQISNIGIASDGDHYLYTVRRHLSDLFVVEGLR